jgi:redox-sensitive bicupin YhaK (pirin superfamily)
MAIYRMYTGEDGRTHIEPTPLAQHPELTNLEQVAGVYLRTRADEAMAPHPAPERRWIFIVAGAMEVRPAHLAEGVRLVPGDIVRITDTTGEGHATTFSGGCTFAVLPLGNA